MSVLVYGSSFRSKLALGLASLHKGGHKGPPNGTAFAVQVDATCRTKALNYSRKRCRYPEIGATAGLTAAAQDMGGHDRNQDCAAARRRQVSQRSCPAKTAIESVTDSSPISSKWDASSASSSARSI